tara:strand:- start:823 stop:1704 length:882 start_codon:yes stop_codon:yes gene_type:complete
MDLNKLKIFHYVAKYGGISLAASELKANQASVSLAVSSLEKDIGCKLFDRHYRGMTLTPEGKNLFNSSKKILEEVDFALDSLKKGEGQVEGTLTIATSFGIASSNWFTQRLHFIANKFPDLRIRMVDYDITQIDKTEADIIICPRIYDRLDFIQEKVKDVKFQLFTSYSYIKKYGKPLTPEDLDHHRLLSFSKELNNPFNEVDSLLHIGRDAKNPRKIFMEVNTNICLLKLVGLGAGIAALATEEGLGNHLISILDNELYVSTASFITYHKKYKNLPKIKAFCETFLHESAKN